MTLAQFQRDGTGDRHLIVVDPVNGRLHEFWQARLTDSGMAGVAGVDVRPAPRTPAPERLDVVRCRRAADLPGGRALRRGRARRVSTMPCASPCAGRGAPTSIRRATSPARTPTRRCRGWASACGCSATSTSSGFPPHARAILEALKTYGMFVADNGSDWLMSIAPDRRIQGLESLSRIKGSDFEVIVPSPPVEITVCG